MFGVYRKVPTKTTLVKKILCDQDYADVSVMAAFREQVAHFSGINVL